MITVIIVKVLDAHSWHSSSMIQEQAAPRTLYRAPTCRLPRNCCHVTYVSRELTIIVAGGCSQLVIGIGVEVSRYQVYLQTVVHA